MSKDINPSLKQLFELIPDTDKVETGDRVTRFIEEGGSVFRLLEMGHQGVVERFGLHSTTARLLMDQAKSLALYAARQYREQLLVAQTPVNPLHQTGIQALVESPTYDELFKPNWEGYSPSGSPDSSNGAAAYLVRLMELITELEKRADVNAIKLDVRRPDISRLTIDEKSMFQIKPTVGVVSQVLENIIKESIGAEALKDQVVDDRLLETRFPFRSMPFEWYYLQMNLVLRENQLLLGNVVQAIDPDSPYFKNSGARGKLLDIVLDQSCNIGPQAQKLLLEPFLLKPTEQDRVAFFKANFGSTVELLKDSVHFCDRTSIVASQLTSLLSIEDCVPYRSANVSDSAEKVSPKDFGSVYINQGTEAPLDLSVQIEGKTRSFENLTDKRLERMGRILRLSRWIDLPTDQCDRLVIAVSRAERRGKLLADLDPPRRLNDESLEITTNTIRAIGLFQEFRQQFGCTAEQFAALIDHIASCGRGKDLSQFDRIFNAHTLFDTPLRADGGYFAIEAKTREDKRTIDQICSSLGINQETWRYLARFVAKSHNLTDELPRSLSILSSFYRLVLLASFLNISPIEVAALLQALSETQGNELLERVLGETYVLVGAVNAAGDVLSVMHALCSCVQWCHNSGLKVAWLVRQITPVISPPLATAADVGLLQEIHKRLQPVLFFEQALLSAGVPPSNDVNELGWQRLLKNLVIPEGLVLSKDVDETVYERIAQAEIQAAVDSANLAPAAIENAREVILALLLQARNAQLAVVKESLSVFLNIPQDLVLPLLKWVDIQGVYLLLTEPTRALEAVISGKDKVNIGDNVLSLLAQLTRRAEIVQTLSLSPAMLAALTTQQRWRWLGLSQVANITVSTLYYLTLFQQVVTHTGQPAEKMLEYLEMVNDLPPELTQEDYRLIRDSAASKLAQVMKWGVREVLECVLFLTPSRPVVRDIPTLDTLLRIRSLAVASGLDAKAIIGMGRLTRDSSKQTWRSAAENVLECLSEKTVNSQSKEFGELGQSVTHDIRCHHNILIANVNGQAALIELVLRDLLGNVLPNITIKWSSNRPELTEEFSTTDHEGRAVVRFKPDKGSWMGTVQIKGTYGLGEVVYAPPITVGCDELSLGFGLVSKPEKGQTFRADGQDHFLLEVELIDLFQNVAVGRTVTFAGQGVVTDPETAVTDSEGKARTRVRSTELVVDAQVVTSYGSKDAAITERLTFVDSPSIRLFEVASMAVAEQPLQLRCHVVGLNKKPSPQVAVTFHAAGTVIGEPVMTDDKGVALCTVINPQAGKQTYVAKVARGDMKLEVDVVKDALIHGESSDYLYPVAGRGTTTPLWVTVREEAHNQARTVANYPVAWSVSGPALAAQGEVECKSDALGRSTFHFEVETAGRYTVEAVLKTPTKTYKRLFHPEVVPAIDWTYRLTERDTSELVLSEDVSFPLVFIRGRNYRLEIDLPSNVDLKAARGMLAWTSDFSASGLGMDFTPSTGANILIGESTTLQWDIDCRDLRNGVFDLTFSCNRLSQRLVLHGRLDAPPPILLQPEEGAQVERMPLLAGIGTPYAQILVSEKSAGKVLARSSVNSDGGWAMRTSEILSSGPHVLSIKQRHIDSTEGRIPDINVNVPVNVKPTILSPAQGAKVRPLPWIEGVGVPDSEVRAVNFFDTNMIYGRGIVDENSRWRLQLQLDAVADLKVSIGLFVDDILSSDWAILDIKIERAG